MMKDWQKFKVSFDSCQQRCGSVLDPITELLNLKPERARRPTPHKVDIHETGEGS